MGIATKKIENAPDVEADEEEFPSTPFRYEYDEEGYLIADGQPMAEYDINRQQMTNTIESLKAWYGDQNVYVSGNNYVHYKKGDFTKHVSPDGYVVFGPTSELRYSYKSWENGGATPAIVFEFTSKKTAKEDEGDKFDLYEQVLKVPEYILFDPHGDYLRPPFQGWRLDAAGNYQRIAADANGRLYSESLEMYLEIRDGDIRFTDAKTGEYLRTPAEEAKDRRREKERADNEARRATREARARREEAQRANSEAQRANEESQARQEAERRMEEQAQKANAEAQLRLEAEAKNAALLAELEALRRERNV